jgi:hypothetical protein
MSDVKAQQPEQQEPGISILSSKGLTSVTTLEDDETTLNSTTNDEPTTEQETSQEAKNSEELQLPAKTMKTRMDKLSDDILDTTIRDLGGVILRGLKSVTTELGLSIDVGIKGKHVKLGGDKETDE